VGVVSFELYKLYTYHAMSVRLAIPLLLSALAFNACFDKTRNSDRSIIGAERRSDSTLFSISLAPGQSAVFNTFDTYGRFIEFKNPGINDSVIEQKFFIDKPMFLGAGNLIVTPGEPTFRTYGVLLNPGDTMRLINANDTFTIQYSSGYQQFVDSMIAVPKGFYWSFQEQDSLASLGVNGLLQKIDARYDRNEAAINALATSEMRKHVLKDLNTNIKYTAIARLITNPAVGRSPFADSLYEDMFQHVDDIRAINAQNRGEILAAIVAYNAGNQNRNLDKNDFWAVLAATDDRLKQSGIYQQQAISHVAGSFAYAPEKTVEINNQLRPIRTQDPFLDTLYQLSNILVTASTDFKKAEKDLSTFAGGRFNFIFENVGQSANREMKIITNLPAVDLYDFNGKLSDFRRIVMDKKYKLTVVDLWASWCVPCIGEMPHWEKSKHKLKGKPIQFVTISIDKDEDIDKWVAVSKRQGIYNDANQYRLANFKESPLTRLLNIRQIPRYLVINNKGDVVDDDFLRPSNGGFELGLLKLL